jgi:hypothetical protein
MCIRRTKRRGAETYSSRLVYLIDEKQLTKGSQGILQVTKRAEGGWEVLETQEKDFHTEEASFRRTGLAGGWELTSGLANFTPTRL